MKKIALAVCVLAISAVSASAADMAVKAAPPVVASAYSWTGFYVGGNVGGGWGNSDPSTSTVFNNTYFASINVPGVNAAGQQSNQPNGFVGGLQLGYNWQAGNFVLGLEGDINSFNLSGSASTTAVYAGAPPGGVCPASCFTINSSASTDWLATIRGRLGVAANNWLFYGTGGAAFTTLKGTFAFSDGGGVTESPVSLSNSKTGYTVGGGVEAGLSPKWTVKAEYLYVNFGTISATGTLIAQTTGQPMFHSMDLKANIVRVGVNYKLD